ncbi:MAG: cupin domain-containing protein [bacterium]
MKKDYLKDLAEATKILLEEPDVKKIIMKLKVQIQKSTEPFAWRTIEINNLKDRLPPEFQSIWVFVLKRNFPSVAHYHPNSIQHTVMVDGKGRVKINKQYKELKLFNPKNDECWCIIDKNMPHEFYPKESEIVVISFHTCLSKELIEIRCDTHEQRLYEP